MPEGRKEVPGSCPWGVGGGGGGLVVTGDRSSCRGGAYLGCRGDHLSPPLPSGRELLPDLRQRQDPEALEPTQGHSPAHLPGAWLRGAGCRRVRGRGLWGPSPLGDPPAPLTGHPIPPSSFDNSQLCSCGADKTVALWDVATGQVVRNYRGHAGVRTRGSGGEGSRGTWGVRAPCRVLTPCLFRRR